MALPREYTAESCPIARSLEIVGERWTLLIVRDAFYGVRRFSDFRAHLGIPKAVLADRLALLVAEGVFTKTSSGTRHDEYVLSEKGRRLWPTIWSLITWGNENYLEKPVRRTYRHVGCGGTIRPDGTCTGCDHNPTRRTSLSTHHADPATGCLAKTPSARCSGDRIGCWNPVRSIAD